MGTVKRSRQAATVVQSTDPPANSIGLQITAYPETEAALRQTLSQALVDATSFTRPLSRCSLGSCKGMCCYDGVYLSDEEASIVAEVATREAAFFRDLGLLLPDKVVVEGDWEGRVGGKKTAVVPHDFSHAVARFPGHFNDTACVFHLSDGRCGLQALSVERGHHPWFYKPFTCWQHPISIVPGEGGANAVILLDDETTDPYRLPDYDGFVTQTFCGRTAPCGRPAYEVLDEEFSFLRAISGRDLASELPTGATAPSTEYILAEGATQDAPPNRPETVS
jgi:hypothetical protein